MQKLESVYARIKKNKKEQSELNKMFKDELGADARYQEIVEELKTLRDEKKGIEQGVKSGSDGDKLEGLKIDIQTDQELLSDIALNMYSNEENIEIVDEYDNKWYPQFRVTFKKSN